MRTPWKTALSSAQILLRVSRSRSVEKRGELRGSIPVTEGATVTDALARRNFSDGWYPLDANRCAGKVAFVAGFQRSDRAGCRQPIKRLPTALSVTSPKERRFRRALDPEAAGLLAIAWGLVVLGAIVLALGYDSMPEAVMLYRPPWREAPEMGSKSLLTVGRIALMGVGQLGAATAMVFTSNGSAPWRRFWRWLGLVAGAKTFLECLTLVAPHGSPAEQALTVATFAVVGVFCLRALWWWRRGDLSAHPPLTVGPLICLLAAMALWALFAVAPRLLT
jgi:hypothetical protein